VPVLERVPLASHTTLGVGGLARYFVEAATETSLLEALAWSERQGLRSYMLGGGSNVVFSDDDFDGLVVRIAMRGLRFQKEGDTVLVVAQAGEPWDALVQASVERNLQGLECLSGIPGLVGATPIQNVGAYGQEVAETIERVRAFDRKERRIREFSRADCGFAYRDSFFKSGEPERYVITEVCYRLRLGATAELRYPELLRYPALQGAAEPTLAEVRAAVIQIRRSKSMVLDAADPNCRSCGSFFVNPIVVEEIFHAVERSGEHGEVPHFPQPDGRVKLSAAWLIERAGFKRGQLCGSVGLSSRHSLALVCHAGARAGEVAAFARLIRARVHERFGVRLIPEPSFVGFRNLDDGLPAGA
jgi:UDP-N-acetylmuramate dehydrogenase